MNKGLEQILFEQKFNLCQLSKAGFMSDYVKVFEEEFLNIKLKCPFKKGLVTVSAKDVKWERFMGHRLPPFVYAFLPLLSPLHPPEWITFYVNVSAWTRLNKKVVQFFAWDDTFKVQFPHLLLKR